MNITQLLLPASLLLSLPAFSSSINNTKEGMETFTITGTHLPTKNTVLTIPKVTIKADEIAALSANSFADVLRGIAGIDIIEQGGVGGLTFLSLRGGDPNFVTIIIDGVKVNDPTNSRGGAFDLGTLDPAMIEKIDVFYGSFSTAYGSDALAGVISIETKVVKEDQLGSVSIKAGSNNTLGGSIHVGSNIADIADFNLIASHQDGDDSAFGDDFKRTEVISSIKSTTNSDTQWRIATFYADGEAETFPEDSGGDRLAIIRTSEAREFEQTNLSALVQHQLNSKVQLKISSAWSERKEDTANPGIAPGKQDPVPAIDSNASYKRLDLNATAGYLVSQQLSVVLGVNHAEEDGGMDSTIDFGFPVPANYTLTRDTDAIYMEAGYSPISRLQITAGIRRDKTKNTSVTTNRLIARYSINDTHIASAHYSEGFKLPSFFALGHPFVGNDKLKPETSENYELSIDSTYLKHNLSSRVSLYQNTYTDLVDFDPIAFTNINRSKVRAKGAEVSAYFAVNKINIDGQISYNKIETFEDNVNLRRRPEWKASVKIGYQPTDKISLMTRVTFSDNYYDSSIPTGMIEMDNFTRIDMSGSWEMNNSTKLRVNINNVLDSDHEESLGFSNIGRSLMASVLYSF